MTTRARLERDLARLGQRLGGVVAVVVPLHLVLAARRLDPFLDVARVHVLDGLLGAPFGSSADNDTTALRHNVCFRCDPDLEEKVAKVTCMTFAVAIDSTK